MMLRILAILLHRMVMLYITGNSVQRRGMICSKGDKQTREILLLTTTGMHALACHFFVYLCARRVFLDYFGGKIRQ